MKSEKSTFEIKLHPLAILNISDHYTRLSLQNKDARVIGAILGTQNGREIEIMNSFEIPLSDKTVDKVYMLQKQEQYKQVFPKLEFLGWYSSGSELNQVDNILHKQFLDVNESPLYLKLDPHSNTKQLPIKIYESFMEPNSGSIQLLESTFIIETGEAERIAVDHVAHISNESENACKLAKDHTLLRQISSLLARLPLIQDPEFENDFQKDYNDVTLILYLATITKNTDALNEKMSEQQDIVLLVMNAVGSNQKKGPVCYYVASLAILRLFPLSYLNEIFPFGIPAPSFLTAQEVKLLLFTSLSSMDSEDMQPVPLSTLSDHNSQLKDSSQMAVEFNSSEFSDIDAYDAEPSFKTLFERVDKFDPELAELVTQKGLSMNTEIGLFKYLGKYFKEFVSKEMLKESSSLPQLSEENGSKEFMILKEEMELYIVQQPPTQSLTSQGVLIKSKNADLTTNELASESKAALLSQAEAVQWGVETLMDSQCGAMLKYFRKNKYLEEGAAWGHRSVVPNKKTVLGYSIVPLSNIVHTEAHVDEDVAMDPVENEMITQVEDTHNAKSIENAVLERQVFKACWWQKVPILQQSAKAGAMMPTLKRKKTEDHNLQVGYLWIRRSWNVEFSVHN
ncbi:hypothetical protein HDV01_003165 [Terramyces sp. JEL0728]|nr:hypothetical protein HDV01_003165 [Terramyces sp. JEL0728]